MQHKDIVLRSHWSPEPSYHGSLLIELENRTDQAIDNFRLCFTSQLFSESSTITGRCGQTSTTQTLRSDGGFHECTPEDGFSVPVGQSWQLTLTDLNFTPKHANDGPIRAFLSRSLDTSLLPVSVAAMTNPTKTNVCTNRFDSTNYTQTEPSKNADDNEPILGVIPHPRDIRVLGRNRGIRESISISSLCPEGISALFMQAEEVRAQLYPQYRPTFARRTSDYTLRVKQVDVESDSYRIEFLNDHVLVKAGAAQGFFYAAITLCHIHVFGSVESDTCLFPDSGSAIEDGPRLPWRGMHVDAARRFWSVAEIKHFMALAAWYKLNRFHWHLTDDEAWRVEINAYPELTAIGSVRGYHHAIPPQFDDNPTEQRGHYSQRDVSELIRFAAALQIEVVPEIDVPGHSTAALRSLPWLVDPAEKADSYMSIQGFRNNCLNPAMPGTLSFVNTVLDELIPLFPYDVFHIGGDEIAENAWSQSPVAKNRAQQLGLSCTAQLHQVFVESVQEHLRSHGKTMGVWDDGVSVGVQPETSLIFVWTDAAKAEQLCQQGYNVVMTPALTHYLDIAVSSDWYAPGASWAGQASIAQSYDYEVPESLAKCCKGVQSGLWAEHFANNTILNELVFPRLQAIAEGAWTPNSQKSRPRFEKVIHRIPQPRTLFFQDRLTELTEV